VGAVLKKINESVYAVEKVIVVVSLLMMSVMVFFDVVHRRYTAEESKLAALIGKIFGLEPETSAWDSLMAASPWVTGVIIFVLVFAGFLTASTRALHFEGEKDTRAERPDRRPSTAMAAVYAAGSVALAWLVLRVMFGSGRQDALECSEIGYTFDCGMFPAGLIWSQPIALVLTAWVGFLGASMATSDNRQLKVEAALRYYPEGVRRVVGLVAGLLTAAFCAFLAYMSMRLVLDLRNSYIETDGLGMVFDGTNVPQHVGFFVLPLGFVLMAIRFVANGVLAFRGELTETLGELGDMDLDAIGEELARGESGDAPPGPEPLAGPEPQAEPEPDASDDEEEVER